MEQNAKLMQESIDGSFKMIAEKMQQIEGRIVKSETEFKSASHDAIEQHR